MRLIALSTCITSIILSSASFAQTPTNHQFINDAILPPIHVWQGKSEALLVGHDHPWVTPFEQQEYVTSPDYTQTTQWLDKLVSKSANLQKVSIGKSPQGRDIWMIIASKEGAASAQQLSKNNKATVLVQAGIHSGEIDGKDAGMMLLRDMAFGAKQALLDNVNLLFIPILSVDAHERSNQYNRVNQRGPVNMGWRTTATNLNLNRDYAKADAAEMQHLLKAINQWQPDLYIDVHVTDGIDYQYDVTFGYNVKQGYSPSIFNWLEETYRPEVESALTAHDHIPGKLIFANNNADMSQGVSYWNPSPRFSNGYGDARHLPTILIENHSLKPFKQRVLGTYVMLEQTLKTVANHAESLTAAIKQDQQRHSPQITLTWQNESQPDWDFKGIDYRIEKSAISGADVVRWNGQPKLYAALPVIGNTKADIQVKRPTAYYIPAQWKAVIDKLALHGIEVSTLNAPVNIRAEQYRFEQPQFGQADYESRQTVSAKLISTQIDTTIAAGTIKVSTAQPLGDLAVLLLEPQAEDSLFYWGFFNTIFTLTEYIEDYAVEPLAVKMLAENSSLKAEFELALLDKNFAQDSKARLRWFYERSPYYDAQYQVYPVLRGID
ncbi:peptidase M14 [Shewanella aestuarii]|uniref:Carboxypeptidase n=2 Tax=Shewanella aestuarii TaxID=1028752 RepID=A0ABT0L568_9GAMM|nr:M14 family metallopeptidase [Shewanella aestuarii]MCL1118565.1 carboxypeptidase [Shewanella aestuarii]GGN83146.1 peptidase M14 [Shewanella aestuarii]